MRATIMGVFVGLALAGGARGQSRPPAAEAAPEAIAAARAEGDAILSAAGARDVFTDETGQDGTAAIVLRHKASGFACGFEPGQALNNVVIYPGEVRGDDVGCNTAGPFGTRTTNFTRDSHRDADTQASAANAIRRRFPAATPAPAPKGILPFATRYRGVAIPGSARFLNGASFEEVISAHVGGWLVEDRFSAPLAFANSNDLDGHWYATVANGLRRDRAAGRGASPPVLPPKPAAAGAPSTPEEIAAARKEGDRILLANHTQALFENLTNSKVIALRHRASGLSCHFDPGASGAITTGPGTWVTDRADAVNCVAGIDAILNTLTLLPNREHITASQALAQAIAVLHTARQDFGAYTGTAVTVNGASSMAGHVSKEFILTSPSDPKFVYMSAAAFGDWIVIDQAIGPMAQATVGNLVGELNMITAIGDIGKTKADKPVK